MVEAQRRYVWGRKQKTGVQNVHNWCGGSEFSGTTQRDFFGYIKVYNSYLNRKKKINKFISSCNNIKH